jgi:tetratricopeptide (TPR) repeat protein
VPKRRNAIAVFAVLLFLGTLAVYSPTLKNGFVNYDDPAYVTENPQIIRGLTLENVKWAFRSTAEANWHPLTWISHMADVQWFGLPAEGHHAQSMFWHAVNVVLLFVLLAKATGFVGRSAVVAGLFAAHPLNVEAVAWVAERKTVLCTFFFLLSLAAYGWYAKRPGAGRYALVAFLFAMSLMSKPTAITLPLALLLIDFWPLERFPGTSLLQLINEKIPLFLMSIASAAITIYAQRAGGAVGLMAALPLGMRVRNAIYSYFLYIEKVVYPSKLAVFHPHPEGTLEIWKVLASAALLIVVTTLFWSLRRRRYLLAGWGWFLVSLLPMIGIVQVGRQAWADRYAYVPLWGLFVIGVWLTSEGAARISLSRTGQVAIAIAVLLGYSAATYIQIGYWKNSCSLFSHAIQVTNANSIAEGNLGSALMEMGRPDLAVVHLRRALQITPSMAIAHYNLGTLLHHANQLPEAQQEYELAVKYATDQHEVAQAHNNLGVLLNQLGKKDEALAEFTQAIAANPQEQNSLIGRGMIEYDAGRFAAAVEDFGRAAKVAPSALANYWQGRVLEEKWQIAAAEAAYREALKIAPDFADAQVRLNILEKSEQK